MRNMKKKELNKELKNDKKKDEIKARLKKNVETNMYTTEELLFLYGIEYAKIIIGNIDKSKKHLVRNKVNAFLQNTEFEKKIYIDRMIDGIKFSDSVVLSDNAYKIKPVHWVATAILLISSILLLISSLNDFTNENIFYNILGLIGLVGSSISIISEVFNIRLIKINTKTGRILNTINNFILVAILLVDILLSF